MKRRPRVFSRHARSKLPDIRRMKDAVATAAKLTMNGADDEPRQYSQLNYYAALELVRAEAKRHSFVDVLLQRRQVSASDAFRLREWINSADAYWR